MSFRAIAYENLPIIIFPGEPRCTMGRDPSPGGTIFWQSARVGDAAPWISAFARLSPVKGRDHTAEQLHAVTLAIRFALTEPPGTSIKSSVVQQILVHSEQNILALLSRAGPSRECPS
jgi:hypothetical protein